MSRETFGKSLSHFVKSVDIVDSATRESVLDLIEKYLRETLDICYFTFYVESSINRKVGLRPTNWCTGDSDRNAFSILDVEGLYQGQAAFAYVEKKSLWIVSPQGTALSNAESYECLFGNADSCNIPAYVKRTEQEIFTSIIIPAVENGRTYGVFNFESKIPLEYSPIIDEEMRELARSISTLFILHRAYENQRQNTKSEINYLTELNYNRADLLPLTKPKVFIASSTRAEEDVMTSVLTVLNDYKDKIETVYWKDITKAGPVTQQIFNEIRNCQYGICYLSEPTQKGAEYRYQDNGNVLIEAGMLSALSYGNDFDRWLPIREPSSGPMPFDFANARTLFVPRRKNNTLEVKKFRAELRAILESFPDFPVSTSADAATNEG